MNERIHIVCLDSPSPPDYGGAIDMYYKIKALHSIGKKITLHYFQYAAGRIADDLAPYCSKIKTYKRKKGLSGISISLPYIISSRINQQLIEHLNKDDDPIIIEGIHCTGIIPFINNKKRKIVVRIHNNEAAYYKQLAKAEKRLVKQLYFSMESLLLNKYQKHLPENVTYACLATTDQITFTQIYNKEASVFIPCFVAWDNVEITQNKRDYCLYHGNLTVSENEAAVLWLIENVFSKMNIPFIIAGKGISDYLKSICAKYNHVQLVSNPSIEEISSLVQEAQINVLPSVNNTGVKLKLLHALFRGRACITNKAGVEGSNLESAVFIANDPSEWIVLIEQLMKQKMTDEQLLLRQQLLSEYNNIGNAYKLSEHLQ